VIAVAMAYAAAIGLMLAIAGLGLERIAAIARRPRRGIWAGLLAAHLAIASMPWWRPASEVTPVSVSINVTTTSVGPRADLASAPSVIERIRIEVQQASVSLAQWGRAALWVWGIGTSAVAAVYLARLLVLARRRRRWQETVVDDTVVFVAAADGPGVAGLLTPRIVLPEWALSLDASERALIIRHEREHLNAHDPLLIQLAAVSVLLMPWNPASWWMLSRLKLAVEIDCDARVLRRTEGSAHADAAEYAELLLTVAVQRSNLPALTVPAMLEPPSSLGRRITAMTPITLRFRRLHAACAGTTALVMLAMLFAVPVPPLRAQSAPKPEAKPAPTATPAPKKAPAKSAPAARAPRPATRPVATKPVAQAARPTPAPTDEFGKGAYKAGGAVTWPKVLLQSEPRYTSEAMRAKIQGKVVLDAVINADGKIGDVRIAKSLDTIYGLDEAAVEAARQWTFQPATLAGRGVPVVVQMELEFRLN
jgi:TonB family protein